MRRLFPSPGDVELFEAYAVPDGRPWLRANMVSTVDGTVTARDGLSAGISGPADRRVFSALRALADVVLVGAGTVRAEGYRPSRLPVAVVTARLDLDPASPLLAEAEHPTIVLTAESAGEDRIRAVSAAPSTEVVLCGTTYVDLGTAVEALHDRGLAHVLCEGGPMLLGGLAAAGQLDELCVTLSPLLAGPGGRVGLLQGPPLPATLPLELAQLLEEEGTLFARYLVGRAGR